MVGLGDDVRWEHFNDLHLISGTGLWSEKLVPSDDVFPPRRGHSAWLFADRYLFVFGGLDHEKLFADLWAFDVVTREWTEVEQKGAAPSRRRAAISFQYERERLPHYHRPPYLSPTGTRFSRPRPARAAETTRFCSGASGTCLSER
jgi:hypothetical protein